MHLAEGDNKVIISRNQRTIMQCELCDKKATHKAVIEGTIVQSCAACVKYGQDITTPSRPALAKTEALRRGSKQPTLTVLEEGYGNLIKRERERKKLTHEQLATMLKERTSYVRAVEAERQQPNDITIKKIEKALNISLQRRDEQVTDRKNNADYTTTIGDVAVIKRKK